jgi:hypothetical protein
VPTFAPSAASSAAATTIRCNQRPTSSSSLRSRASGTGARLVNDWRVEAMAVADDCQKQLAWRCAYRNVKRVAVVVTPSKKAA